MLNSVLLWFLIDCIVATTFLLDIKFFWDQFLLFVIAYTTKVQPKITTVTKISKNIARFNLSKGQILIKFTLILLKEIINIVSSIEFFIILASVGSFHSEIVSNAVRTNGNSFEKKGQEGGSSLYIPSKIHQWLSILNSFRLKFFFVELKT